MHCKSIYFILFSLTSLWISAQNVSTMSSESNAVKVKVAESVLAIEMIQPMSNSRGNEPIIHNDKTLTVKGRIISKVGIQTILVNKMEADVDSLGYFTKEVRIPYLESEVTVKVIDKKNGVVEEKMMIIRPQEVDASMLIKRQAKDYALLIGTNEYKSMPKLKNPVFDVRSLAGELSGNYGFQTDTLINPSLNQILSKLRKYSTMQFNDNDQLFIFIAGHGEFDPVVKEGYIVPKDAIKNDDNKITYLDHSKLKTILNNIPCKHIFVALDVCFGGTFDQAIASRGMEQENILDKDAFITRKLKYKTRLYLTSGGKEYVPDGRPGAHSPFARRFLEALRSLGGDDKVLTISELFSYVDRVTPEPRKGEFGDNEPGSDFLFIAR